MQNTSHSGVKPEIQFNLLHPPPPPHYFSFRDPVTPVFNERIITIEDPSFENPVEKCSNAEEEISRILRKSYQDDLNNMANMNGRMGQVVLASTEMLIWSFTCITFMFALECNGTFF